MKINIEKSDTLKLQQLVIAIDAEEFVNGSGRVTICASVIANDGHVFVLRNSSIDVPKIEFPPRKQPKGEHI